MAKPEFVYITFERRSARKVSSEQAAEATRRRDVDGWTLAQIAETIPSKPSLSALSRAIGRHRQQNEGQ
jgi:hypothetical protein